MVIGSKSGHRLSALQMVAALKIINPPSPDHTGSIGIGIGISGKEKEPSKAAEKLQMEGEMLQLAT